jgi:hypothetical protein
MASFIPKVGVKDTSHDTRYMDTAITHICQLIRCSSGPLSLYIDPKSLASHFCRARLLIPRPLNSEPSSFEFSHAYIGSSINHSSREN